MSIEERIARTIGENFEACRGRNGVSRIALAAALMPLVRRAQAEAEARALRNFRASLIADQLTRYGIVLPDVDEIVDALGEQADRIENEGAGAHD